MKNIFGVLILISVTFFSCVSNNNSIENRKWYLREIEGDIEISLINQKAPYIEFNLKSHKVGGNATCNNFFGDYFIDGNRLYFGPIATTMMACNDESNQEYRFLQALDRTESYILEGDLLSFYEGKNPILIFNSIKK